MSDQRDRYILIKKLAEGGMASVFLARDTGVPAPRLCVVKQLLPQLRSSKEHVNMFLDEIDLAARLAHPNIVRTVDRGTSADGPFLVLEYLAGFDLDLVIARLRQTGAQIPWTLATAMCAGVADAMAYAHDLKTAEGEPLHLIHRDLNPSNVFITFDGLVKVLDFGIARSKERRSRTTAGVLKGKARYLAPELIRRMPADGRIDQFSLGATLFEALALKPMFRGDNELAVIHSIIEGDRPSLRESRPDIPLELDGVYRTMTAKDPPHRFADMGRVSEALWATLQTRDLRLELSNFLQTHFAAEFESHASLMARLAVADVKELQEYFERGASFKQQLRQWTVSGPDDEANRAPLELPAEVTDEDLRLPAALAPLPVSPPSRLIHEPPSHGLFAVMAALLAVLVIAFLVFKKPRQVAEPQGTVLVRSNPPGATIRLDGNILAKQTPEALPKVGAGRHELRLDHPECLPFETAVVVEPGKEVVVDVALQPREAMLTFEVQPLDAVVSIDGRPVELREGTGRSGPLAAGTHEVEVRAFGYVPQRLSLALTDGMRLPVTVELKVDPHAAQP